MAENVIGGSNFISNAKNITELLSQSNSGEPVVAGQIPNMEIPPGAV